MNNALCTADGLVYSALEFSRLPTNELEWKRRFLQCPSCQAPGFFRHESPIGRAACFGARPHVLGCQMAAQDFVEDFQDRMQIRGEKIIVDFQYGANASTPDFYSAGSLPRQDNANCNYDKPHTRVFRQRLGSLLVDLTKSSELANSSLPIEIIGRGEMASMDLFVPLHRAGGEYSGHYRGYYGVISDAKRASDQSLWFNSGGNDNISFCLDKKFVDIILDRYGITNLENIAGANILVFGTPRVSQNGKLFCLIDSPECIALRLT